MTRGRGQWNAYVAAGATREERARRLAEVPEAWRSGVESHVRTVFALRRWRLGQLMGDEDGAGDFDRTGGPGGLRQDDSG